MVSLKIAGLDGPKKFLAVILMKVVMFDGEWGREIEHVAPWQLLECTSSGGALSTTTV